MAQQAPATPTPATLTLTATSEVQAAPDIASIGAGVVTQAAEAQAALAANSEKMVRVVAALKKAGIAERDIQTSGLNLQPQFRYEQNQPPALTGFQASNRVQVTLRDVRSAGKVIDALVKEGANQIDGPDFRVDNPEPLLDRARTQAVQKARARAELYAAAAGLSVKRITAINEGFSQPAPMPKGRMVAMEARADAAPPVAPGEVGLSATVTMEFELGPR
nr:SIMPL domain-containing protein [Sandaracinobacteroides sayramensis]